MFNKTLAFFFFFCNFFFRKINITNKSFKCNNLAGRRVASSKTTSCTVSTFFSPCMWRDDDRRVLLQKSKGFLPPHTFQNVSKNLKKKKRFKMLVRNTIFFLPLAFRHMKFIQNSLKSKKHFHLSSISYMKAVTTSLWQRRRIATQTFGNNYLSDTVGDGKVVSIAAPLPGCALGRQFVRVPSASVRALAGFLWPLQ